jgi:trk system potassium uptake protein
MFVIIVGGGKTGSQLASGLLKEGYQVKIVDDRQAIIERLKTEIPPEAIYFGDGSSPDVLEEMEVQSANVLAAVTGDDEANLVVCTLAKFEFNVPRVIARVNNPKNAWLFNEEMGVDVALNQADILAHLIAEEMSLGDMMTLLKLRKGEFSVVEEKVHETSAASGHKLMDLVIPPECIVAAIIRKGKLIIPHGDTVLQPADEILAIVHAAQVGELAKLLNHRSPGL